MSELSAADKLAVLSRAVGLLASSMEFEATLAHAIAACLPALGDFGFFDVVVEGTAESGTVRRTSAAYQDPRIEAILAPSGWVRNERKDMNLCALSSGRPGLHPNIDDGWYQNVAVNEGHLAVLRDLGFISMLTVPMRYRDELVGSLTLFFGRSGRHHTDADRAFATELAALCVPAVVNARLVEQHRRAVEQLRESEERLRLAADAGQLGLWDWNVVDDKVTWSDSVYDLHGLPRGQFGGTVAAFAELVHPDDREHMQRSIEKSLTTDATFVVEFRAVLPDGNQRWLATRGDVVRDANGKPLRLLGATIDITPRVASLEAERNARAEAERARRDAEHASRAKDEFLAILGHELRNPLAPIVSALELLDLRNEASGRREREIISRQVNHLSRLVDDLLDVSRIVRGKVELDKRPVDMEAILDKSIEMTHHLFAKRSITLEEETSECWVTGDPVRLAQVVGNLLTNAAKFTRQNGHVRITLHATAEKTVELVVTDNGEGISAELLPNVFGLFVQGPQALDRRLGGLGLGLAIVSNLVQLHGGQVSAHSDGPGQGSTFRVTLPATARPTLEADGSVRQVPEATNGRLLIVDDNEDSADLLADLLRASGFEVVVEHSAAGALKRSEHFRPDLAILDIGLPEMDGHELARALRARIHDPRMRLIALTGYGRESDRALSKTAGFDAHLVKPVMPKHLLAEVQRLLAEPR